MLSFSTGSKVFPLCKLSLELRLGNSAGDNPREFSL